jgi:HEAT repeat protein
MSAIDDILADAPGRVTTREGLERRGAVIDQLAALGAEASPELERRAERLSAELTPDGTEQLTILLEAMRLRGQDIAGLAERALVAKGLAEREPIVELLEVTGADGAIRAALPRFDGRSDPDGFLRTRMIGALGALGTGAGEVTAALGTEDTERVRVAAVRALDELDARDAAPALIERLDADSDPDVVALAARVLARWDVKEAIPSLEALATSEWAKRSEEIRDAAREALDALRPARS